MIHQTPAIDVWSCGIIFMCILSRRYPLFYQKSSLNEYYELMEFCSFFGSESVISGLKEMNRQVENIPFVEPAPLRELFLRSQWDEWMVDVSMDLLMKMLEINPAKRITVDEALNHMLFLLSPDCLNKQWNRVCHPIDYVVAEVLQWTEKRRGYVGTERFVDRTECGGKEGSVVACL